MALVVVGQLLGMCALLGRPLQAAEPIANYPGAGGLPQQAFTGGPGDGYTRPGYVPQFMQPAGTCFAGPPQLPCPCACFGPWKPPGISGCPWPADEYICDGGVQGFGVHVRSDWKIDGLEQEDTIVHADTIDNRTIVEPSNRVCIYAPRFAAVRKVDVPYDDSQLEGPIRITQPIKPSSADESQGTFVADQPLEPLGEVGSRGPNAIVERQRGIDLGGIQGLSAVYDRIKPYEDFTYIRAGIITEQDKPLLAQRVQNAITWTGNQALEVQIDGRRAKTLTDEKRVQTEYTVDVPNHPRLQVCKIASTNNAQPGETVDFTIRFDNVGDQKIGNVTIVDSLTTRLEYVPGSSMSSLKGNFSTLPNEAGSLVLRWELTDPLPANYGGVVRFQCKVR